MLQQTQVRTVIPYWERWLREFPNVGSLAIAHPDRVLKLWEGLGYYSRARNLQRAAQIILREHSGKFPRETAALLKLPGIGPYTAGAIASIAFNRPEPILDGNVIRVLTRLLALPGDPRGREVSRGLWDHARKLVEAAADLPPLTRRTSVGNCSALNQALMELGATVCTSGNPRCEECPLRQSCTALKLKTVAQFPETAARPAVTLRRFATAVIMHRNRFLLRQRPAGEVNGSFWEFPNVELARDEDPLITLAAWLGLPARCLTGTGELRHTITRYRMIQHVFRAELAKPDRLTGTHWATPAELDSLALTAAHRKLAKTLPRIRLPCADVRGHSRPLGRPDSA